jgi:hypothetical protein
MQIAKRNLSNFNEISVISFRIEILRHLNALSTPFYTPNVLHVDISVETPCKSQNAVYQISTKSLSFRSVLRYYGVHTLFPLYYTPNVVHVDFSVETIPANRKTQSFKIPRNLCHLVPDWDTKAFKRSLHSILHAESIACRLQRRNNHCKSQKAISQISMKSLSFSHWMRYYGI